MHVFIVTLGSRGDVQPYVALGQGFTAAGHTVTLCTSARFEPFITEHGLRYGYMNDGFVDLIESATGRELMEDTTNAFQMMRTALRMMGQLSSLQRSVIDDSWAATRDADPDVIVYHPKAIGAPHFAEKLGIPCVMAPVVPILPTSAFPAIGFPPLPLRGTVGAEVAGWYNRATYLFTLKLGDLIGGRFIDEWRSAHGLPPRPPTADMRRPVEGLPPPVVHGYSRHVLPPPPDWPARATVAGYWFLDRAADWSPPAELQAFLDAGAPPVYVGFGSMAGRNPARLTRIVTAALELAGVRGIVATGWGGLDADDLPDTIFKLDAAPHDWLFPRMAVVVHHGGAGTTAAGLRAGRPTVVCPFFGDQPFWGRRVHALGAGPPPRLQKALTAIDLAAAIRRAAHPAVRQRAEALGTKIRAEDGIATAVRAVEAAVRGEHELQGNVIQ